MAQAKPGSMSSVSAATGPDVGVECAAGHQHACRDLLPRTSWDVNTWAWMEVRRNFRLRWYKAGYSDSILNLPT